MAEDPEKRGKQPNLELPTLFSRRKKRREAEAPPEESESAPASSASDTAAETAPGTSADDAGHDLAAATDAGVTAPDDESASAPDETSPAAGPTPIAGSPRRLPPTPPPPVQEAQGAETEPVEAATPGPVEPETVPEPTPEPEPTPAGRGSIRGRLPGFRSPETGSRWDSTPTTEPETEPGSEPSRVQEPETVPPPAPEPVAAQETAEPVEEETSVLPRPVPAERESNTEPVSRPGAEPDHAPVLAPHDTDEGPGREPVARERREVHLPRLDPRLAAVVTGLIVGAVGVVLSYGASRGCEAVRGVGSCGGTGLFALLAVLAIEVLLGAVLLKAWRLSDPVSTSFLGVGLVAVLALLFFLGSLESIWMLVVIPVLTAITFLLSWWVTDTFVEQGADDNMHH